VQIEPEDEMKEVRGAPRVVRSVFKRWMEVERIGEVPGAEANDPVGDGLGYIVGDGAALEDGVRAPCGSTYPTLIVLSWAYGGENATESD
jgi:hypothetical protein